jgi:hypothetical protein
VISEFEKLTSQGDPLGSLGLPWMLDGVQGVAERQSPLSHRSPSIALLSVRSMMPALSHSAPHSAAAAANRTAVNGDLFN